jgi:hypothetical protein
VHALPPRCCQADREALSAQLSSMEDWLYDEGEDETKSVYVAKLAELRAKGDPIAARAAEDETRPGAWGAQGASTGGRQGSVGCGSESRSTQSMRCAVLQQ